MRDLPKSWKKVRLDSLAEVRLGRQRSPARATGPCMTPYMRAANVTWGGIDASDVKEMDFTPAEMRTYALRSGDILLSEASGSPSEVGKPAVWRDEIANCAFQNTLIRVRAPTELVGFLHLHFVRDVLTGRFADSSRGVGIHLLGAEKMSAWEITLPPPAEQHRIVAEIETQFTRLDAAVATLERVKVKLKRARASVLKSAVEGRLVPTEAELSRAEARTYEPASVLLARILDERKARWPKGKKYVPPVELDTAGLYELPEGWVWATVEQVADIASGQTLAGLAELLTPQGEIPWFRVGDMNTEGNQSWMRVASNCLSAAQAAALGLHVRPTGTIIFPKRGGAIATNKKRRLASPAAYDLNTMGLLVPDALNPYLWVYFLGIDLGSLSDGSNVPQLNNKDIGPLPLPLPPLAEQLRIVAEVDRRLSVLDALDATVDRNLARCARLRQSILKMAFEGRLVPSDHEAVPSK